MEERRLNEEKLQYVEPAALIIPPQQRNYLSETRVHQWMSSYLGINIDLIVSRVDGQIVNNVILRCPISSTKVLKGRIQSFPPPWPSLLMYPRLRIQNVIPSNSTIAKACQQGNTELIKELIFSGMAHPNDSTVDKISVLHVCLPGIHSSCQS